MAQSTQSADQLNEQFGMDQVLRFEPGPGGLVRALVSTDHGQAEIYTQGAHVCAWRPKTPAAGDQPDVLWVSDKSRYESGQAIRGGIPVCFPWFGPKADDPEAPMHGLARLRPWELTGAIPTEDGACLFLTLHMEPWECTLTVGVGRDLTLSLKVTNVDAVPQSFEAALHTYFNIRDIRQVRITGLEEAPFIDKVAGGQRDHQGPGPITFEGETDRVYLNTAHDCTLEDPGLNRLIHVSKRGSQSTVVWNPWIDKAGRMDDFGNDEWQAMVCIETANALENAITLEPRQSHEMTATLSIEAM